uniref:Transmembrane protein 267 n=1 Tax=Ciona intestinalis TaxID=7719 RepID=H2Y0I2_CIOIN
MKLISLKLCAKVGFVNCFCVVADLVFGRFSANWTMWERAVGDSLIHCIVAIGCWWAVTDDTAQNNVPGLLLCGFLSSLVDIDHFIEAKSFALQDAISVNRRGIFHCFIAIPLVAGMFWFLRGYFENLNVLCFSSVHVKLLNLNLPLLIIVAWFSHQLRDSTRRGLYLFPGFSTAPVPIFVYLALITLLCYIGNVLYISKVELENVDSLIV